MTDVLTYVLVSDLARYYVVIAALWLIAVLLRLAYLRVHDCFREGGLRTGVRVLFTSGALPAPHPFSTLGLAVLMFVAILRRFETLGQPGDIYLWLVTTGVTLVLVGVLINVRFTLRPPWKRH